MGRRIAVAACQMDVEPAPMSHRLDRAAALVGQARRDGAELVVLPELFNLGYGYGPQVVARAEAPDGPTASWIIDRAQAHQIHVAGSFLVRDGTDVLNAFVLAAPDGQTWRYDKVYPWAWERSVFTGSRRGPVVADTALGRLGMLVCWDAAHPSLWQGYAERVQMMIVSSCPVGGTAATYRLDDGRSFRSGDLPGARAIEGTERLLFQTMVAEQAAWLRVPIANTGACGRIATTLPRGPVTTMAMATLQPRLWSAVLSRITVEMTCDPTQATLVEDAEHEVSSKLDVTDGETYTVAEVELPDAPPATTRPQPKSRVPAAAYALSDHVLPRLMEPVYATYVERAFGSPPQRALDGALRTARAWIGASLAVSDRRTRAGTR